MINIRDFYIAGHLLRHNQEISFPVLSNVIEIISISTIKNRSEEYQLFAENLEKPSFCIYFDTQPFDDLLIWLCRFILLPSYDKKKGKKKIFANNFSTAAIHKMLLEQGFTSVDVIDVTELDTFIAGDLSGYLLLNKENDFLDLIILKTALLEINVILKKSSLFQKIMDQNPNKYFNSKLKFQDDLLLRNENEELKIELQNHKKYLEIALNQKETENILDFYHKQYEVLPLWYKRFGHLIKIILGKRKFKN